MYILEATMPGLVLNIATEVGAHVERGQTLVVINIMKMEISVASEKAGLVKEILVHEGDALQVGVPLIHIQEDQ